MHKILEHLNYTLEQASCFEAFAVRQAVYHKDKRVLVLDIQLRQALPYSIYQDFLKRLKLALRCDLDLRIQADEAAQLEYRDIHQYLRMLIGLHELRAFAKTSFHINGSLNFLCLDETHRDTVLKALPAMKEALHRLGLDYDLEASIMKIEAKEEELVTKQEEAAPRQLETAPNNNTQKNRRTKRSYTAVTLKTLNSAAENIEVAGEIFAVESRPTRNGSFVVKYFLHDTESAIQMSCFVDKEEDILEKGTFLKARGQYFYDERYERDYIFRIEQSELMDPLWRRFDTASEKRTEFHLHTKYSEMDGINDISDYLEQAMRWDHPGLVITDHVGVQSFPKAYKQLQKLRKTYSRPDFKLGYGVEMNVVDDALKIVSYSHAEPLHQGSFVVFDIETTGLSAYFDHIIEFGAVLIENGQLVSSMQTFIQSPVKLSRFTMELTHISQEDVDNAPSVEEALDRISAFIQDKPLVAHNASFDYDFLQEVLRRHHREPLSNALIDTLDLSRALFANRRNYRLGGIARLLKINYDEDVAHRADYDAEVLSMIFLEILNNPKLADMQSIDDLQSLSDDRGFAKVRKNHLNVIARNKTGLKELYELVSLSHTKYLAFYGKTSGKDDEFMAEPRITKAELAKHRENLLIGAGCTFSDVFEVASNKSQKDLEDCIDFYDYVEIMPLEIYQPLIYNNSIPDEQRLYDILDRIISTATKLNVPILAVGNVHYNEPYEKIIRDVYIHAQGIGGTRHPLFIFNREKRLAFNSPNQHFRSTDEMLESFRFTNRAEEFVVDNPRYLLSLIEDFSPKQERLFTPKLENSDELLRKLVYQNAFSQYGNPLPEIIEKRIANELNSIIGHGYGVTYYIAHLLVKKSLNDGYLVGSRGSVGSSLVATLAKITEVNPLPPHYYCPSCHYSEFYSNGEYASGFDLKDKVCPHCGHDLIREGQDIPFETFLGFEGDKVPDIDLNFSGDYQEIAHDYTHEIFGKDYVYRAGTISTVAQKTAFGYVLGYHESLEQNSEQKAYNNYLASKVEGVKRTTGQHPGGIIVIPNDMDVHDFTPIQYPANNPDSSWYTTHFEFHDIDDNVLKLDILGHVDPTAMKLLEKLTGIDVAAIPMNDEKTLSIFNSSKALGIDERHSSDITGAAGLPEFGTPFVRKMLEATLPRKFSDLIVISGLSHGTGVWLDNAETLIQNGATLDDVIGCRDDIMTYLVQHGLPSKKAFDIMESVRKGKGLNDEWIGLMKEHKIPSWYIDSCQTIKYMFPKAHAVAYVMMAVRVAWFKVYYPLAYYAVYFTLRVNAYEIETMVAGRDAVKARLQNINDRLRDFTRAKDVSIKEKNLLDTLEITLEMLNRGYHINPIDLNVSLATEFCLDPKDDKGIIPPFIVVDGLGANVAEQIVRARTEQAFISKKDLMSRGGISTTTLRKLDELGVTSQLPQSNQMSLF